MELPDHWTTRHDALMARSSPVSTSIAAHMISRPFTLSTASSQSTAIGLLPLGGMVHPTEPSARAQSSTDAWEGFLP